MSLDTLAFCSQKIQLGQSCKKFTISKKLPAVASAPASGRRLGFVRFVERTVQEKGLDFRFLLSRKIDPPLRSVAVREARAKRATTARCGGNFFFLGGFFSYIEIPGSRGDSPLVFSRVLAIKKKEKKFAINREFVKNSRKLSNLKKKLSKTLQNSPILPDLKKILSKTLQFIK